MIRRGGWAVVILMAGGLAQVHSARAQRAEEGDLPGWQAVQSLKPGTNVVVEELSNPGDYRYRAPCKLVRVNEASLTCRTLSRRNQRVVYPASGVLTVYQVKMRITAGSWSRIVLFGGLGFLLGCAITDENADYPLGAMGAVGGAAAGAERIAREPKFALVYRRTRTPVEAAAGP